MPALTHSTLLAGHVIIPFQKPNHNYDALFMNLMVIYLVHDRVVGTPIVPISIDYKEGE